jgi:hypothetical protein
VGPSKHSRRLAAPVRARQVVPFAEPTGAAKNIPYYILSGLARLTRRLMSRMNDQQVRDNTTKPIQEAAAHLFGLFIETVAPSGLVILT